MPGLAENPKAPTASELKAQPEAERAGTEFLVHRDGDGTQARPVGGRRRRRDVSAQVSSFRDDRRHRTRQARHRGVHGVSRATVPALAVLVFALAGCATTIDEKKAEKLVTKTARSAGAQVKRASCPGGLNAKKGNTFTCEVTGADGSTGKVLILEKDAKGNATVRSRLLVPATLERFVGDTIRKQVTGRRITSRCPDIVVARKGGSFVCHVSGDDGTRGDVRGTEDGVNHLAIDANFLHTGTTEIEIARDVAGKTGAAAVEAICPAILTSMVGQRFDCDVTSGKDRITVVATQTNAKGGFSYRQKR